MSRRADRRRAKLEAEINLTAAAAIVLATQVDRNPQQCVRAVIQAEYRRHTIKWAKIEAGLVALAFGNLAFSAYVTGVHPNVFQMAVGAWSIFVAGGLIVLETRQVQDYHDDETQFLLSDWDGAPWPIEVNWR